MTTSNLDIQQIARMLKIPSVKCMFDNNLQQLPLPLRNGYYVLNLGDAHNLGGTHWVGLCMNKGKEALYFDSFGAIFSRDISYFIRNCSKKGYNETQLQDIESNLCGFFVLAWMKHIHISKKSMYDASEDFINEFSTDMDSNSQLLRMKYLDYPISQRVKQILLKDVV